MVKEYTEEEREHAALREAVAALADDANFKHLLAYLTARMGGYIEDLGNPACYTVPAELSNTSGRIDELRQLLSFIEACRPQ